MRTNIPKQIMRPIALGVAVLIVVGAGACAKKAAAESAYCDAARTNAVYELSPRDDSDPKVFEGY